LYQIRRKLIRICVLIDEREKLLKEHIMKVTKLTTIGRTRLRYLNSLIQSLKEITAKLIDRITQLQHEHPLIGSSFIYNNEVSVI